MTGRRKKSIHRKSEIHESDDLDVEKILNFHLKEVLDLVRKSTAESEVEGAIRDKEEELEKTHKYIQTLEDKSRNHFGDSFEPCDTTEESKISFGGETNASNQCETARRLHSPDSAEEGKFPLSFLSWSSSAKKSRSSSSLASLKEKLDPEHLTKSSTSSSLTPPQSKTEDEYFTIYRTSVYRASIYGSALTKADTSATSAKKIARPSTAPPTQASSTKTRKFDKKVHILSTSTTSKEESSSDIESTHSRYYSKMRYKMKAPIIPLRLEHVDYTPDDEVHSSKDVDTLVTRYKLISEKGSTVDCNSPRSNDNIFNRLVHRFNSFLHSRIYDIRDRHLQKEKMADLQKELDNTLLECPLLARDSKLGKIWLAKALEKWHISSRKVKERTYVTPPGQKFQQPKEMDFEANKVRRKTIWYTRNPMSPRRHEATELQLENVPVLSSASQMQIFEATDFIPDAIDYQTADATIQNAPFLPLENIHLDAASRSDGRQSEVLYKPDIHTSSSMEKIFLSYTDSFDESEKKISKAPKKLPSFTAAEIYELLENPELTKWEQLYVSNPNFSFANYVNNVLRRKEVPGISCGETPKLEDITSKSTLPTMTEEAKKRRKSVMFLI